MPNRARDRGGPAARPPRGASTLAEAAIVEAAIRLADAGGLDAVSIRRVAAELNARPMSLYTYISSKDTLLDLMADELIGGVADEPVDERDWRAGVSALAHRLHDALVEHPWLIDAFRRRRRPGPNTARYAQALARAVAPLDLPAMTAWTMLGIVNDYTLGHALRVATAGHAHTLGHAGEPVPDLDALTAVDSARDTAQDFELGLHAVLDGIDARLVRPLKLG